MGRQDIAPALEPTAIRAFTKALLSDLRALERIVDTGMIESGVRRFGMEQEVFFIDSAWRPNPIADRVLARLDDPRFTTELAQFNAEINLDPLVLEGSALTQMQSQLEELLIALREAARAEAGDVVLTGILPSLSKSDLSLDNITPRPRYYALNEAVIRMRNGPVRLMIEGTDELHIEHESVMLEACNTSLQVHLQVSAAEFPCYYNIAQAIAGPTLAAAVNSPFLFGKRLWNETRIALFQQSVDTRAASPHLRELSPRVRFGESWINESVVEAFQEDVARFRVLLASEVGPDPFETLQAGHVPELKALQLHNSTVYRWNRPCYGVKDNIPHLRIECRALPAGPSTLDEMANAAFWIGLMLGAAEDCRDVTEHMHFDDAKANFLAAARHGLRAVFTWLDGKNYRARDLILDRLLPLSSQGLAAEGIAAEDIERYLDVIRQRVLSERTGARWLLESVSGMKGDSKPGERMLALTAATVSRQHSGEPGYKWSLATLDEMGGWAPGYMRVEQYMTTDLFTVSEDELVELAAFLMDQRRIRHVLVEDHDHKLVGIISYRSLIRLLAHGGLTKEQATMPIRDIMERNLITVTPETHSIDALRLMREKRISVLPVIKNGKLVGVVSERDFMDIAGDLLQEKLKRD